MNPVPLCIGHSHAEMVARAARQTGAAVEVINFWDHPGTVTERDGVVTLDRSITSRLRAPLFSLVGGAVHLDVGLMRHPRPFDFVWPNRPELPVEADAEILPFVAVERALRGRIGRYLAMIDAIRGSVAGRMYHMQPPPVRAHEVRPQRDPDFAAYFGADSTFAAAWLRFKLWSLQSDIMRRHCETAGIPFICHPPEAATADGFLRDCFAGTPGHANEAYGVLLLGQIAALACGASP